mmetsp:Transcript_15522/g.17582  ORF Transcript_15522/g.17582 Transcript_15522/m.17582 type:complete len:87 (-) Transcript_15522:1055-1315(-)
MAGPFKTFVLGNSQAHREGKKSFVTNIYGEDVSYLKRPYVEKSRRMLCQKLRLHQATCTQGEIEIFNNIMAKYKLDDIYPVAAAAL